MLKYSKTQKRRTALFFLVLLLAAATTLPPFTAFLSPGAFLYLGLVLAWGLTVMSRILQRPIRRLLLYCCGFMVMSFVLRICRYELFREIPAVSEYTLYLYGVCYTMTALLAFLTVLCVGREDPGAPLRFRYPLWAGETLLCIAMLSNPLHRLFYTFASGSLEIRSHGPVYYLMVIWCAALALASFVLLLAKCRNSRSRKYWFLPAAAMALGTGLLVWYFLVGGAPQVGIYKLFNLQEVFCLTVILPFEAIFRIGLIPTNSDYGLFFRQSVIKAAILDKGGETVAASPSYRPEPLEGERARSAPISGGSVVWTEDISEFLRLRKELTALNEELDEENELILQERQLREERITFETRNRLYDSISLALQPQTEAMLRMLDGGEAEREDPAAFRRRLEPVLVMGAYMKRMGNLMLLGDGKETLPAEELALSISESFEYLGLGGIACGLRCGSGAPLPVQRVLLCYRVFERLMEENRTHIHACEAELLPEAKVLLRVSLDCPKPEGTEDPELLSALENQGLTLEKRWEDDTWFLSVREGEAGA